jgi:hypothetical protein
LPSACLEVRITQKTWTLVHRASLALSSRGITAGASLSLSSRGVWRLASGRKQGKTPPFAGQNPEASSHEQKSSVHRSAAVSGLVVAKLWPPVA